MLSDSNIYICLYNVDVCTMLMCFVSISNVRFTLLRLIWLGRNINNISRCYQAQHSSHPSPQLTWWSMLAKLSRSVYGLYWELHIMTSQSDGPLLFWTLAFDSYNCDDDSSQAQPTVGGDWRAGGEVLKFCHQNIFILLWPSLAEDDGYCDGLK